MVEAGERGMELLPLGQDELALQQHRQGKAGRGPMAKQTGFVLSLDLRRQG